jgi:copper chaperone CopZ
MQIVTVRGMAGERCAKEVTTAIRGLDPCANVAVDLIKGLVLTDSVVPKTQIVGAIEAAGYHLPTELRAEKVLA